MTLQLLILSDVYADCSPTTVNHASMCLDIVRANFHNCRVSQLGEFVPIAPALCCKSCISDKIVPADSCFDLNFCSGHGACNLGVCECQEGYGGADCKYRVSPSSIFQTALHLSPFFHDSSAAEGCTDPAAHLSEADEAF